MIYERIRARLLELLKAPLEPPDPPAGSESSVQVFRAAPKFLLYQMIVWGLGFAGGFAGEIVLLVTVEEDEAAWIGWTLLVLTLLGAVGKYFLIRIDYDMRYYVVTDRSLRIREGALVIHESTYTFANVQNLRIHQGPVERLLGIANLVVETAGGGSSSKNERERSPFGRGHEGVLRGIVNAREVRDQILHLLRRYGDTGLGDPEDARKPARTARRPQLPDAALARLREIRDELRALRAG